MNAFKICKTCETSKELTEFNKMSSSTDGRQHNCRECNSSYQTGRKAIRNQHVKNRLEREAKAAWKDEAKLKAIWKEAKRLTETTGEKYQVDHLIPIYGKRNGVEIVCGFHVEYNVEIVLASENMIKGHTVTVELIEEEEKRLLDFCKNNNL